MKTTILYLHDSTAVWMLWQGKRLLQVFNEPVTRAKAEQVADAAADDGIDSMCPWLTSRSPKVRLVIDPVMDKTQSVSAFDFGLKEPNGFFERVRRYVWQVLLTCRSLTSDVLIDDVTRYRREQLSRFPSGILQWYASRAVSKKNKTLNDSPAGWLLTDSGVPDYVLTWLQGMAEQGLEYTDVRPVSALFAKEDASYQCTVITVWTELNRCRLIMTANGYVVKVEQWASQEEAVISLKEAVATREEEGVQVKVFFLNQSTNASAGAETSQGFEMLQREDVVNLSAEIATSCYETLPLNCSNLPLQALLQSASSANVSFGSDAAKLDYGSNIRFLLSTTRWRRRYKQTIAATTVAAAFAGYFVLLAVMHALNFIELHERANQELTQLNHRQQLLDDRALELHSEPSQAIKAIRQLDEMSNSLTGKSEQFLSRLGQLIEARPNLKLSAVSWRYVSKPTVPGEDFVAWLSTVRELIDTPVLLNSKAEQDRLIFLSGNVVHSESRQQASETLMDFLNALKHEKNVLNVIPVTASLSSVHSMNLPSDATSVSDDPSAFVVAVLISV